MDKALLIDLFRVLVFPKDKTYFGDLNPLYDKNTGHLGLKPDEYLEFNQELLRFLATLVPTTRLCLYTAATQFQHDLRVKPILDPIFASVYSTEGLGMRKTDPESFQLVCSQLQAIPSQVIYVGDNSACVEAAAKAGLSAILYTTNSDVISAIQSYLTS